jgi:hypothetical protein
MVYLFLPTKCLLLKLFQRTLESQSAKFTRLLLSHLLLLLLPLPLPLVLPSLQMLLPNNNWVSFLSILILNMTYLITS